ncbi:single-stranded DNA-binding protein [Solwaraspora sp. WMMA2080]|uniref:single-stranded DNA-binding protein n=1 Tax=unclassified Solwaraspora TaxID=2627926 RepID=UPI00248A95CB|nr:MULTISPECIES: single-stranded DNA-binding protein [unclassified Solwaraspora]WBB95700.1 single-stranded DNA-binding protein [Solwaraspora sp. WMMA2059]WBC20397.1 single-stranded DNA-binding protein [Solwaraspora sp. WMMA2080]
MFDTYVTVVGNVLTTPEWRRTTQTNTLVANFKVASTARRLDRESNRWVDGNSLRVRVNCWRKLAEGVCSSVMLGDPVVVVGRLYTRDWVDGDGNNRLQYEMEAVAVGHDLARGRGRFTRNRPTLATSEVDGDDPERRVQGEATAEVPAAEVPATRNELFDGDDDPMFLESSVPSPVEGEPNRPGGRPITLAVDVLAAEAAASAQAGAAAVSTEDAGAGTTTTGDDAGHRDELLDMLVDTSSSQSLGGDGVPDDPTGDPLPAEDRPASSGRARRSRSRTAVPV